VLSSFEKRDTWTQMVIVYRFTDVELDTPLSVQFVPLPALLVVTLRVPGPGAPDGRLSR
jgi:hypothetical protein